MSSALELAFADWKTLLGRGRVLDKTHAASRYGACTTGHEPALLAALAPHTAAEVRAIVEIAAKHKIPLHAISTGNNWGYGSLPVAADCVLLDLSRLDRIIAFDAECGTVTLEPGVTQQHLRDYLDRHSLPFLVPVTGAGPSCSLLANALERGYGITPHADHFGAVMQIEAVLPDGRQYRSALGEMGAETIDRSFKWGVGPYLDGLFAQGNVGIVTSMTIALARRPEVVEAFYFGAAHDDKLEGLVNAIQDVLAALPGITGSINLMNPRRVLAMTVPYPRTEVGKDDLLPEEVVSRLARQHQIMPWMGVGAIYGRAEVVKAARRIVKSLLKPHTARLIFLSPRSISRIKRVAGRIPGLRNHRLMRTVSTLHASMQLIAGGPSEIALPLAYWQSGHPGQPLLNPARDGCGLIWYPPLVPMKAERVRIYVEMVTRICREHRIEPLITLTSLSERCFDSSVPLLFDRQDPAAVARGRACYTALFHAGRSEGFIPYRLNTGAMSLMTESGSTFWNMAAQIKNAIDPDGIFSPGRYAAPK